MKDARKLGDAGTMRAVIAVLVVALSIAGTGCGGSGSVPSRSAAASARASSTKAEPGHPSAKGSTGQLPAPSPPTDSNSSKANDPKAARFISAAERICRRLNFELKRVNAKLASKNGKLTVASIVHGAPGNAIMEDAALTRLRRLKPPSGLASSWQEMLNLRRELAQEIAQLGLTVQRGNNGAAQHLETLKQAAHKKLAEVAAGAGMKDCGEVG